MGSSSSVNFNISQMPSLVGKIAIVTGGNAGIGFGIVKGLVSKGATVIVASRNQDRVNEAVTAIKKLYNGAKVDGLVLDVSSFSSIDTFVTQVQSRYSKVDILINNAGVFLPPYCKTEQGFDVILGTNVIGTAYLTTKLLPLVAASELAGRIVFLSSSLANEPTLKVFNKHVADISGKSQTESSMETYGVSKLLDSMYAYELQRRLTSHARPEYRKIIVTAADPGFISTTILTKIDGNQFAWFKWFVTSIAAYIAAPPEQGALSSLYCATTTDLSEATKGGTVSPGPKIRPYNWTKAGVFTADNSRRAFDAIDTAITQKGFTGFL